MSTMAARARATPAAVVPGARRASAVACQARWPAGVAVWLPDRPSRSRAARFGSRRMAPPSADGEGTGFRLPNQHHPLLATCDASIRGLCLSPFMPCSG